MTRAGFAALVRALGGDLYGAGLRANVPAPGHSPADRSVSLLLSEGRLVVHAFGAADWREVRDDLRRRGLFPGEEGARLATADDGARGAGLSPAARRAAACRLWSQGGPVSGVLSETHIRSRGVARALPDGLRHHSAVAAAVYAGRGPRRPALLAAVDDPAGALCAVEVTYLASDGGRARARVPRKTVGVLPPGCAVRLDPAASRLMVAEGVFSALSASERFGLPAWALLAAHNLRAWTPPASVRQVVIAADRGATGEAAALTLAARLRARGLSGAVRFPPWPAGDWNEAAGGLEGEEGQGGGEPNDRVVREAARSDPDDFD